MTKQIAILEINDVGVLLHDTEDAMASPGFALFEDNWVALGEDAKARFRLHPMHGNNTFWQQLNKDPLSNASPLIRHSADLVYHHLAKLFEHSSEQQILICHPGFYSDEQLSLLLGICQSLNKTVVGLVDNALLQAGDAAPGRYFIVDQLLHHCIISQVDVTVDKIHKTDFQLIANTGQQPLTDALVHAISDEFIRQTRFNPLHNAEQEQLLYNQLPDWLQQIRAGECSLQLAEHSITLGFSLLHTPGQQLLEPLLTALNDLTSTASSGRVLFSNRAEWLQYWYHHSQPIPLLKQDQIARLAHHYSAQLIDTDTTDGTLLTEQLTPTEPLLDISEPTEERQETPPIVDEMASEKIAEEDATARDRPTHILVGHRAHPIGQQTLWLAADQVAIDTETDTDGIENSLGSIVRQADGSIVFTPLTPSQLNGAPLSDSRVIEADSVLGNQQVSYQFIRVLSHG